MAKPIVRAYIARVEDVNARDRTVVGKINTGAVDRYRTMIDPRGIKLEAYRSNPVVLFEHGRDPGRGAMPVGRNDWIKPAIGPDGPELIAKTRFFDGKKSDEFTERLFECYKDGDMRGLSVNVIPDETKSSPPTADELHERPELQNCLMCYRSSELAEYSAVAVPGNAQALTMDEARSVLKCVSRGLELPTDLVKRAKDVVEPEPDPEDEERTVRKEGDKWCAYHGGKKLGEFDTEEEAKACKKAAPEDKDPHGGKDDEKEDDDKPDKGRSIVTLPPLGGRSLAAREADLSRQIRGMFNTSKLTEDLKAEADLRRGRV